MTASQFGYWRKGREQMDGQIYNDESPLGDFFLGILISLIAFSNFGWIPVALGWANNRTMFFIFLLLGIYLGMRWAISSWQRLKINR